MAKLTQIDWARTKRKVETHKLFHITQKQHLIAACPTRKVADHSSFPKHFSPSTSSTQQQSNLCHLTIVSANTFANSGASAVCLLIATSAISVLLLPCGSLNWLQLSRWCRTKITTRGGPAERSSDFRNPTVNNVLFPGPTLQLFVASCSVDVSDLSSSRVHQIQANK